MTTTGEFTDQWIVVSGAGRGIGAEIARMFAKQGASLILLEAPEKNELLADYSAELAERYQSEILPMVADFRQVVQIKDCVEQIRSQVGKVDVLVNNAGINIIGPALSYTEEDWDSVLDVNLKGTFFLTQGIAKLMLPLKKGSIISIASQHGVVGNENRAAYCASKAGIVNMTRGLAFEWAKYGIRVNTVSPTFVLTETNEPYLMDSQFQRVNLPRIPLRKYAEPKDVAHAVLFLASDKSRMVTGHNLIVDGGWTAI